MKEPNDPDPLRLQRKIMNNPVRIVPMLLLTWLAALPAADALTFADPKPQRFELTARASEIDPRARPHPEIDFVFEKNGKAADVENASVDTRVKPQGKLVIWLRGAARGEIATQSHRNRTRRNFRQTRRHNDMRRRNGPRQTGGERKRHGQSVGHANDNVAHRLAGSEMFFDVCGGGHKGL
jgi:hypothetical protein